MQYVELGRSGLQVSRLALGSGSFLDASESALATIRTARDRGINFVDCARVYGGGRGEEVVGAALRDELRHHRDELVVASKGGLKITADGLIRDATPEQLRQDLENSLLAVGIEHFDLYHVHWPDPKTPVAETAGALQELVTEGKIRHLGLSNYDVDLIEEFIEVAPVASLQPGYHLFDRAIEAEILPFAQERGLGVAVYGSLGHGFLSGKLTPDMVFPPNDFRSQNGMYLGEDFRVNLEVVDELKALAQGAVGCTISQLAMAWVLANTAVDVAIVGTGNPHHLEESIAVLDISLSPDVLAEVDAIMQAARPSPGPTPETTPFAS